MSAKNPDDMMMETTDKQTTNPIFELANSVSAFFGTCVQKVFPSKQSTTPDKLSTLLRPNAVVLLNAHGNYPYDLFQREGNVFTRSEKEKSFSQFTIGKNILNILSDPSTPLSQDAINTLFNNVY